MNDRYDKGGCRRFGGGRPPQKKNPHINHNTGWKKPWERKWSTKEINSRASS